MVHSDLLLPAQHYLASAHDSHMERHIIPALQKDKLNLREGFNGKKGFLLGIAQMREGGLPMPDFFGPLFRSAFLVNKKSLFLQKCQCIDLLTVFLGC